MRCCGYGGYIDPGIYVIAGLKKGDEITLQKGFGYPEMTKDGIKVIYKVDGYSAICTDGTILICHDGNGIIKTGRNLPAKPSYKVFVVIGKTALRRLLSSISRFISNLGGNIWYFQYRLKNKIKKIHK